MRSELFGSPHNRKSGQGYSLIELLIVVATLGILAAAVGSFLSAAETKAKSLAFNIRSRFQQAKAEAVSRGKDVYLDFDFNDGVAGTVGIGDLILDNGFTTWVDEDGDAAGGGDFETGTDTMIDTSISGDDIYTVEFENMSTIGTDGIEIYTTAVTGGPATGPPNSAPSAISDGVEAGGAQNRFQMKADGTSVMGTLYLYWANTDGGVKNVAAGPYAIRVNSVGRIKIYSWSKIDAKWLPDD